MKNIVLFFLLVGLPFASTIGQNGGPSIKFDGLAYNRMGWQDRNLGL